MTFLELVQKRESCRGFLPELPPLEKLIACVDTARLAPSACNSQPWRYTIITEPSLRDSVCRAVQDQGMNRFASEAPAFIVVEQRSGNLSSRVGGVLKGQDFASVDIGIGIAHLCLAAADAGLSTCILGWLNQKKLRRALHAAGPIRLVVAIGYARSTAAPREKNRRGLEDICQTR